MTTYTIEATYTVNSNLRVDFPEGKTWDDVEDWHIRWNSLLVKFRGRDDYAELPMFDVCSERDGKFPTYAAVYPYSEEDGTDYSIQLAHQE